MPGTRLTPLTEEGLSDTTALLQRVARSPLSGVTYLHLSSADGSSFTSHAGAFDADLSGVLLSFGPCCVAISWAQKGEMEGLVIVDAEAHDVSPTAERIAVGDSPQWRNICGRTLSRVSFASTSVAPGTTCIVGARFDTDDGHQFAVTLGADAGGQLEHMPDEVVVIFDRQLTSSFRRHWSAPHPLSPG